MSRRHFAHAMLFFAVTIGFGTANSVTTSAVAQSASIAGRVVDGNGQPVPGVSVTTREETGDIARAISGSDGAYRLDTLQDGTYRVDFDLAGFDLIRRNHVRVRHDATAKLDAALSVSAICECLEFALATPLRARAGQVVDESGRPLAHARLEVVSPMRREVAYANGEGRFQVRVPVDETWPLTAYDTGFGVVTQQVSGTVAVPIVFKLARGATTSLPDNERFTRNCRCPGDLFTHPGR